MHSQSNTTLSSTIMTQNSIKTILKSSPAISADHHFLVHLEDTGVGIKCLLREASLLHTPVGPSITKAALLSRLNEMHSLSVLAHLNITGTLTLATLVDSGIDIIVHQIIQYPNVAYFGETLTDLIIVEDSGCIRILTFADIVAKRLDISSKPATATISNPKHIRLLDSTLCSNLYFVTQSEIVVYAREPAGIVTLLKASPLGEPGSPRSPRSGLAAQMVSNPNLIKLNNIPISSEMLPYCAFRNRFVFCKGVDCIQIIDAVANKIVASTEITGQIKQVFLRQNVLMVVSHNQSGELLWVYELEVSPQKDQIIKNRLVYDRESKSDYMQLIDVGVEALQGYQDRTNSIKGKDPHRVSQLIWRKSTQIDGNTASIVFFSVQAKNKTHVAKIMHSKLLQSPFSERKINKPLPTVKIQSPIKETPEMGQDELSEAVGGYRQNKPPTEKPYNQSKIGNSRSSTSIQHSKSGYKPKNSQANPSNKQITSTQEAKMFVAEEGQNTSNFHNNEPTSKTFIPHEAPTTMSTTTGQGQKPMQVITQRHLEKMIDERLQRYEGKFQQLSQRVSSLEDTIKKIYEKVDESMKLMHKEDLQRTFNSMLEEITPQFERYFSEVFKQVAQVLDKGVDYYNLKLKEQAHLHESSLKSLVTDVFTRTQEMVEVSRSQATTAATAEQHLRRLSDAKKKWYKEGENFKNTERELPLTSPKGLIKSILTNPARKKEPPQ